jgi:hypothetical protein
MEMSDQLHAPAAYNAGKEPQYPLDRRLGGPQNQSGSCGEDENLLPLLGVELQPSSPQPVDVLIEPSWLLMLYLKIYFNAE